MSEWVSEVWLVMVRGRNGRVFVRGCALTGKGTGRTRRIRVCRIVCVCVWVCVNGTKGVCAHVCVCVCVCGRWVYNCNKKK